MTHALYVVTTDDPLVDYSTTAEIRQVAREVYPDWPMASVIYHRLVNAVKTVLQIRFFKEKGEMEFSSPKELRPFIEAVRKLPPHLNFDFGEICHAGDMWLIDPVLFVAIATTDEYISRRLHEHEQPWAEGIRRWQDRAGQNTGAGAERELTLV